jgi:hypothetical protein
MPEAPRPTLATLPSAPEVKAMPAEPANTTISRRRPRETPTSAATPVNPTDPDPVNAADPNPVIPIEEVRPLANPSAGSPARSAKARATTKGTPTL